jgi:putative membrane protein
VSWQFDLLIATWLLVASGAYGILTIRLVRRTRRFPRSAVVYFVSGLVSILVAVELPLVVGRFLAERVVQDELLLWIAPLFFVLSLSPRLLAPLTRRVMKPLLRNRRSRGCVRVLTHPAFLWLNWLALVWLWHVPAMYDGAFTSAFLHSVESVCFLAAGFLFWVPVFEPIPSLTRLTAPTKLVYLLGGLWALAPLGAVLVVGSGDVYVSVVSRSPIWGLSHVADQHIAAAIVMASNLAIILSVAGRLVGKAASGRDLTCQGRRLPPALASVSRQPRVHMGGVDGRAAVSAKNLTHEPS